MVKRGITQKDIATRLGVSQALVSRALSGTSAQIDASPVTVAAILKAAAEWNYHPNAAAQTLKGAPTRTLGVIVKDFDDPFFGHLIGTLQGLASENHYGLFLIGWDQGKTDAANEMLLRKYQPDGLIICGSDYSPPVIKAFTESDRPVVQIGLGKSFAKVSQVGIDEAAGLSSLVDYLRGLGHRRFAFAGLDVKPQRRREAALRDALAARGLPVRPEWFNSVRHVDHLGPAVASRLLAGPPETRPTVIIAADDVMAQRILRVLHERGVHVPTRMSLAGFDDIPAAGAMIPSLTSVRQPLEAMVRHAFALATGSGAPNPGPIVVAPELVVRESCAPPSE